MSPQERAEIIAIRINIDLGAEDGSPHPQVLSSIHEAIREAEERVRRETIEECARVVEGYYVPCMECTEEDALVAIIANAIRSLSVQTKGTS